MNDESEKVALETEIQTLRARIAELEREVERLKPKRSECEPPKVYVTNSRLEVWFEQE